jgi:hypothetical protein
MSIAERIRQRGELKVHLPELDVDIEVNVYRVRHMLQTGLGARILDFKEDSVDAEAEANLLLEEQRETLITCSAVPKIVREETNHPDYLYIGDIPDGDIAHAFDKIVTVDDSRFYGTNRTAFGRNPEDHGKTIDGQMKICYEICLVCNHLNEKFEDVLEWDDGLFALALEVLEGAEGYRKAHPPKKEE